MKASRLDQLICRFLGEKRIQEQHKNAKSASEAQKNRRVTRPPRRLFNATVKIKIPTTLDAVLAEIPIAVAEEEVCSTDAFDPDVPSTSAETATNVSHTMIVMPTVSSTRLQEARSTRTQAPVSGVQQAQSWLLNSTSTSGLAASAALLSASSGAAFQSTSALGRAPAHQLQDPSADFSAANFAAGFFSAQAAGSLSGGVVAGSGSGSGPSSGVAGGMDTYPLTHHLHQAPTATYVTYDATYPTYYQHYQPIQSPQQDNSYILQTQQNSPVSADDGDSNSALGQTQRTPPQTLEWLSANYEPCEGASLPRCTLYEHYCQHCKEENLEPVNAASFGKLIRSVFKGLRTRRLGTRGNSKYHYNGIRIKPGSALQRQVSQDEYARMNHGHMGGPPRSARRISGNINPSAGLSHGRASVNSNYSQHRGSDQDSLNGAVDDYTGIRTAPQPREAEGPLDAGYDTSVVESQTPTIGTQQNGSSASSNIVNLGGDGSSAPGRPPTRAPGDGDVPNLVIANSEELRSQLASLGMDVRHVTKFAEAYAANCEEVLNCLKRLHFDSIEGIWSKFWQSSFDAMDIDEDSVLPTKVEVFEHAQIFQLCSLPLVQKYVETMDLSFYQVVIDVLMPNVLSVMDPRLFTQVRNFSRSVEDRMRKSLQHAPQSIHKTKMDAVHLLSLTLKRYTTLNHLAQAVRSVLQNEQQIKQIEQDFNRVDLSAVHEQAGWVCNCDPGLVSSIEEGFKENLRLQKGVEEWAEWMEAVVDQVLAKYHDKPASKQAEVSKQFLLKWSFYSSTVIRELTLRSAESFGSFHLIRLLYDEYMLFLVEMKLAKATNQPMICVMGQNCLENACTTKMDTNAVAYASQPSIQQPISHVQTSLSRVPVMSSVQHMPASTSSHIQYVMTTDSKYAISSMPQDLHSHDLDRILVEDDELTDSTANRYVVLQQQQQDYRTDHAPIGTIVYMQEEEADDDEHDGSATHFLRLNDDTAQHIDVTETGGDHAALAMTDAMENAPMNGLTNQRVPMAHIKQEIMTDCTSVERKSSLT